MNSRVLRYFTVVADEGSLSKAAVRLGVAQPALSKQISVRNCWFDPRVA